MRVATRRIRFARLGVLIVCVLLFAALGASPASAAAKGTDRPWKLSGSLPGVITGTPETGVTVVVEGTVHAAHLGLTEFRNVVFCPTGCAAGGVATFTFTAANGDMLSAQGTISGVRNFTGGTGRFEGATGSFTVSATTEFIPPGQFSTFVITFTETGTI